MLENNLSLTDDDTASELYLDAIDKESSSNLLSDNDKDELHEFKSSLCVWEDAFMPFEIGIYSQILETRVVLNSNCPKGSRYPGKDTQNASLNFII